MGIRFADLERKLGEIDRARVMIIFRQFINLLANFQIQKMIIRDFGEIGMNSK